MNPGVIRLSFWVVGMVFLASCGSAIPQPGAWTGSEEEFGQIGFVVSEESTSVTEIDPILSPNWSCGDVKVTEIMGYTGGDGTYPITEGIYEIELVLLIGESIFEVSLDDKLFIEGSFDGAKRASGTWEFDFPERGENCSGTWTASP